MARTTKRKMVEVDATEPRDSVTRVKLETNKFHTVVQESPIWKGKLFTPDVKGAFLRVQPPEDATDERIAQVVEHLHKGGAEAVHVEPRPRSAVVPVGETKEVQAPAHRSIRAVVEARVARANTKDRAALKIITESALARAGL